MMVHAAGERGGAQPAVYGERLLLLLLLLFLVFCELNVCV